MTDQLRLGTLGDEIFGAGLRAPTGDAVLQTGATIPIPRDGEGMTVPIPLQGDGMTVPIPLHALGDDLPQPPLPFHGGDLMILHGGISIPTP